jgi:hypothetical protein
VPYLIHEGRTALHKPRRHHEEPQPHAEAGPLDFLLRCDLADDCGRVGPERDRLRCHGNQWSCRSDVRHLDRTGGRAPLGTKDERETRYLLKLGR